MSKILLTGGLGVVGSALAGELEARGHEVWRCDLAHSHLPRYVRCDVGEFRQLERLFAEHSFEYVYHLAAEFGRWNGEDYYEQLWKTNAVGTKNVIRLQERYGFRLIHFSSSEIYGDYGEVMREDVPERVPIQQMNDYAISKWVNELQIENSRRMAGTETVRVRLFNTYGPGEFYTPYRSMICRFTWHALRGEPYTVYLGHHRTNTYIGDCVRALAELCGNFIPGRVYNIASEEYRDIRTVSDLVLLHAGRTDELVTYRESEPQTTRDKKVDCSLAARELGLRTTVPLEEGIKRYVAWIKKVYRLS